MNPPLDIRSYRPSFCCTSQFSYQGLSKCRILPGRTAGFAAAMAACRNKKQKTSQNLEKTHKCWESHGMLHNNFILKVEWIPPTLRFWVDWIHQKIENRPLWLGSFCLGTLKLSVCMVNKWYDNNNLFKMCFMKIREFHFNCTPMWLDL